MESPPDPAPPPRDPRRALLAVLLLLCVVPAGLPAALGGAGLTFLVGPPAALLLGAALALTLGNPAPKETATWSKRLLQASVVGLGFGLDAREVVVVARDALPVTLLGIAATFAVGLALGHALRADGPTSLLVTTGTAICGGSAIAAMAPVVEADERQTGAALATVFTLNAVALVLFPPLGLALGLDPATFGAWAALAIHDTSSVVGAASAYDHLVAGTPTALAVGTTTKLARALWILPLVLAVAWWRRSGRRAPFPTFLLGFAAAVALRALAPSSFEALWSTLHLLARQALVVTILLIGVGLGRDVLRKVGPRPLVLGVLLWVVVAAASLGFVAAGWVPLGRAGGA
ncbi:MAG: putative sulfate exporter family transporter [Planctomycetes bacterium]|nr:putative sulfate exporter family transporter [Planctomycetota bacterium]